MKMFYIFYLINLFNIVLNDSNLTYDVSKLKISLKTDQIMLVIPKSYKSYQATFYYYIKKDNIWTEFLVSDAAIGRDGLGLQSEYDVKSPVGAFKFNKYFGINDNPGTKMPYIKLNSSLYWDGDSNSKRYNQMVNIETYKDFDKSKSEHLIEQTLAYKYAMNINYNEKGIPNKGSAIFLHCYTKNQYTAGCVAIPEDYIAKVLKKVNKGTTIIIDVAENIIKY